MTIGLGKNQKSVIILSGGMDSATLLYDIYQASYDVHAITFDYNQKHKKEIDCARVLCQGLNVPHKIINIKILNELAPSCLTRKDWDVPSGNYTDDSMKQTVVPNRNMVMLSLAASYAIGIGANSLFYGAHSGDHAIYPDCRRVFVSAMQTAFHLCDWNDLTLHVPYLFLDKKDIVYRGINLHVPYELTWTCYKGEEFPCGTCGSCRERIEAFREVGLVDPLRYQ